MKKRTTNLVLIVLFAVILGGFMLGCILAPDSELSYAERRKLKQFPTFTWGALTSGDYFTKLEDYFLDQFVLRDDFRAIKAFFKLNILQQKDNNKVYVVGDGIYKMEYPLNESYVAKAAEKYNALINKYFGNSNVFYTIVPDKNYFVADENGYLSIDYEKLEQIMKDNVDPSATYIDIFDKLTIDQYYHTDLHWKQESITDLADYLLTTMGGASIKDATYTNNTLSGFHGSYYGQLALNFPTDTLTYLTNDMINAMVVKNPIDNTTGGVYSPDKFTGIDGYDVYLQGAQPLLVIENPNATTDKELIVFRDSYGSSIAPLLAQGYSKVTLVDIRYVTPEIASTLVDFNSGADVLLMYNALMLNNSPVLKG